MGEELETILEKSGGWGKYQKIVVTLIALVFIPLGFTVFTPVFTYHTPPHRCFIPELDEMGSNTTANRSTLEDYIPTFLSDDGDFELASCVRYVVSGNQTAINVLMRNATHAVGRNTEECIDGWVYMDADDKTSVTTEFNLVCKNAWKKPLLSSGLMFGFMIGSIMSGPLNDKFGRRIISLTTIVLNAVLLVTFSFTPSYELLVAVKIGIGITHIICFLGNFVLAQELVDKEHRAMVSCITNFLFSAGYVILPGVAYLLTDWRWIIRACGLCFLLFLPYIFFLPESPRWLASKGRNLEANKILKRMAHWNGKDPSTLDDLGTNNVDVTGRLLERCENSKSKKTRRRSVKILATNSVMRNRSLLIWWLWNVSYLVYYALGYNTSNLSGNIYWNCFIAAGLDFPCYIFVLFAMQKFGRRSSVSACFGLAGFSLAITPAFTAYPAATTTFAMVGKFFATSTTMGILVLYTSELYPTLLRNTGLGMASMSARIGSIAALFLIFVGENKNKYIPFYVMAALGLVTAVLCLFLPETKHYPLPDTMLDAVKMEESRMFSFSFKKIRRRNESQAPLDVPKDSRNDDVDCDDDDFKNDIVVFEESNEV